MKNSKKFLSAILSAAVLTSSIAAIPASADYTTKESKTTLVSENFDNPSVKNQRFLPAPFTQGSRGCSRTSAAFDSSRKYRGIVTPVTSVIGSQ